MTSRARLGLLGRRLGVERGHRVECPSCGGAGVEHEVDGAWAAWDIARAFARIGSEMTGEPMEDVGPEPDEAMVRCSTCQGAGAATAAQVDRFRRAAEDGHRELAASFERIGRSIEIEAAEAGPDDAAPGRPVRLVR